MDIVRQATAIRQKALVSQRESYTFREEQLEIKDSGPPNWVLVRKNSILPAIKQVNIVRKTISLRMKRTAGVNRL